MIDMRKAADAEQPDERPVPPRTINVAVIAVCLQVAFAVGYVIVLLPLGDQLRRTVIKANADAKKPRLLCNTHPGKGCLDAAKTVRTFQTQAAIGTVLIAVIIVFVAMRMRKGIRSGRTMYVAVSVVGAFVGFVGSPLAITAALSSGPALPRIATTLAAASAMAALILVLLPESRRYFDAVSPRPNAGQPRARGSLFGPRPAAGRKPPPGSGLRSSAASRAQARAAKPGVTPGSRSKTRANEAAVAHGAELARSRAKASKSRRTEL
ncbi:MAG: hypothetical protein M3Y44_06695 [Actinomycetota bacterium]|nr:hypothetical protein [Actinomycetota bacterium]